MLHTGQGQIIEAQSITQDELGNWVPAKEEPYHPSLWDRLCCFFGWHTWRFDLERVGNVFVVPDMIPDDACCIKCATPYGVGDATA